MALQRRTKVSPTFNMSSMTDIIFLLLIFFMVISTLVTQGSLKVNLPQSDQQRSDVHAKTYVVIDSLNRVYVSINDEEQRVDSVYTLNKLLQSAKPESEDSVFYISIYSDEQAQMGKAVEVFNEINKVGGHPVIATRPNREEVKSEE